MSGRRSDERSEEPRTARQEGMSTQDELPVLTDTRGRVGHILLNRPKAINALTQEMVELIDAALTAWEHDDEVQTVLLTGSGERGLCAGGDIVALYEDAKAGGSEAARFWSDEYRLNSRISRYPKPFVAIMDGIVLGGGIGLSAHADVRVVTERSSIGMPETGIGFLPDVGGTWLLSRTPGQVGTHLALTAGSVKAGDAIALGLADWFVESERLPELYAALETEPPEQALPRFASDPPEPIHAAGRHWIDPAYAADDVASILAALDASEDPHAAKAASTIRAKSPTSCVVTLRALREAESFDRLEQALDQEYRLALRIHADHDFVEGVRAQVVDKDRNPQWEPASVEAVDPAVVEHYFSSLGDDELGLADAVTTPSPSHHGPAPSPANSPTSVPTSKESA